MSTILELGAVAAFVIGACQVPVLAWACIFVSVCFVHLAAALHE